MRFSLGCIVIALITLSACSSTVKPQLRAVVSEAAPTGNLFSPTDLVGAVNQSKATLTWKDNSTDEAGFIVERQMDQGAWQLIAIVDANMETYIDPVIIGHGYCYRAKAFASMQSVYTNTACIDIPGVATAPDAPTEVTIDANMVLHWVGSKGADGYHILCAPQGRAYAPAGDPPGYATAYHVNKCSAAQIPSLLIKAWNQYGESGFSNAAKIPQ